LVVNLVLKKLGEELNSVCPWKNPSNLRKSTIDDILNFLLEKVCLELKERTPLFCANAIVRMLKRKLHGFLA
jgi:hypothetical protein